MKKILTLLAIVSAIGLQAQTNKVIVNMDNRTVVETNAPAAGKSESGSYEFTLGSSGEAQVNGHKDFALDFSISTNPLEKAPSLWIGYGQGFSWDTSFSGSSDLTIEWSWHLFKELYLNTGVSGGIVYFHNETDNGSFDHYFRYGPELNFEYYLDGGAFIYAGANYDFRPGTDGIRYSLGLGLSF